MRWAPDSRAFWRAPVLKGAGVKTMDVLMYVFLNIHNVVVWFFVYLSVSLSIHPCMHVMSCHVISGQVRLCVILCHVCVQILIDLHSFMYGISICLNLCMYMSVCTYIYTKMVLIYVYWFHLYFSFAFRLKYKSMCAHYCYSDSTMTLDVYVYLYIYM